MDELNNIIANVENSTIIQNLQKQWFDAQAAGASQAELDAIHNKAQQYRQNVGGYTANADGSEFTRITVIGDQTTPKTSETAKAAQQTAAAVAADLNIDGDKLIQYGKYALIALIGLTVIDGLFGK